MADAELIRAVAIGRHTTGIWQGEEAQIGVSLCVPMGGDFGTGINDALLSMVVSEGGGSEIVADVGRFDYGSYGADGQPFSKADQLVITNALKAFVTTTRTWQHTAFKWQEVRLSAIKADGHVVNGATVVTLNPTVDGTDSAADYPPSMAVVASMITGGRGPRNRGRLYLPVHSTNAGTGGIVGTTPSGTINTAMKTLKDTIEAGTDLKMAVVSQTHHTASAITQFAVGNHFDVQRRRVRQVPETYTVLAA